MYKYIYIYIYIDICVYTYTSSSASSSSSYYVFERGNWGGGLGVGERHSIIYYITHFLFYQSEIIRKASHYPEVLKLN